MSRIDFPRWIYKGKTEQKIVQNMDEYQTALAEGWRKGVIDEIELEAPGFAQTNFSTEGKETDKTDKTDKTEAPKAPEEPEEPEETTMSYREMLEANAKKLNIKYGIKTSNSQLAAMIQRRG